MPRIDMSCALNDPSEDELLSLVRSISTGNTLWKVGGCYEDLLATEEKNKAATEEILPSVLPVKGEGWLLCALQGCDLWAVTIALSGAFLQRATGIGGTSPASWSM